MELLTEPSYFQMVWAYVAAVGWYIVGLLGIAWYAHPYIKDTYTKWKNKRDEAEYAAKYHKDLDLLQQRLSGLEVARLKMQEEYEKAVLAAKEEQEKKKQKKREEISKMLDDGHRLGGESIDEPSTSSGTKSKSLRPEYNPLMGDGSRGYYYRPPRRSCCRRGGCG